MVYICICVIMQCICHNLKEQSGEVNKYASSVDDNGNYALELPTFSSGVLQTQGDFGS